MKTLGSTCVCIGILSVAASALTAAVTLTSASGVTVAAAAGSGTFTLSLSPSAAWTASSSAAWLTVSPASGNANATITYSFTANSGANARMAAVRVTGKTFSVLQLGSSGNYTPWGVSTYGRIQTIAGNGGVSPSPDGVAATATAVYPAGIAVDANGNVFVADSTAGKVRRIDSLTGVITAIAGTGGSGSTGDGGPASLATLSPGPLAFDAAGDLFVSDPLNNRVRRIDAVTGTITTVAGTGTAGYGGDNGLATAALLNNPQGLALDTAGNLYIADYSNHRIRRVDAVTGIVTTVAGIGSPAFAGDGGAATAAAVSYPLGVALDGAGNLFIADTQNVRVRRVDAITRVITTVAGGGNSGDGNPATSASISPRSVAADASGNLYISDGNNSRIRRVDAVTGIITSVAGNGSCCTLGDGGLATQAWLSNPLAVVLDGAGDLYIADSGNRRVRFVDQATPQVTLAASSSSVTSSAGSGSVAIAVSPAGASWIAGSNVLWLTLTAGSGAGNGTIAYTYTANPGLTARTGLISVYGQTLTVVQAGPVVTLSATGATALAAAGNGTLTLTITPAVAWTATSSAPWLTVNPASGNAGASLTYSWTANTAAGARLAALTVAGKTFTLLQLGSGGAYTPWGPTANGEIITIAGNGASIYAGDGVPATTTSLTAAGVAVDNSGNVYIADQGNHRIRRVDAVTGLISTIAGTGAAGFSGDLGPATSAKLNSPAGIAVDSIGNIFIADTNNNRIRRVDAISGIITTVAGSNSGFGGDGGLATAALLNGPDSAAVDPAGNLYIADTGNNRIRRVDALSGGITTIAGGNGTSFSGDGGPAVSASLSSPQGIAVDSSGNIFIADTGNSVIRRVSATGIITTVAGGGCCGGGNGGPATSAALSYPRGLALDSQGNLFIADTNDYQIRRVDSVTGVITAVAGSGNCCGSSFSGDGGPASQAMLSSPSAVAVDARGNLYIADTQNFRVRFVDFNTPKVSFSAAAGTAGPGAGSGSIAVTVSPQTSQWAASSSDSWLTLTTGSGVGNGTIAYSYTANNTVAARAAVISLYGATFILKQSAQPVTVSPSSTTAVAAAGSGTVSLTVAPGVTWTASSSASWVTVSPASGTGNGSVTLNYAANAGPGARLASLTIAGKAVSVLQLGASGAYTPWATTGYGQITTIAGNGTNGYSGDSGPATAAAMAPTVAAVDPNGNVFIAESNGNRVRRVDAVTGKISTVTGTGSAGFSGDGGPAGTALLNSPRGIALDNAGNLYIADSNNYRIRRVDALTGYISTVAGSGSAVFSGDGGSARAASLNFPGAIAFDASGNLLVAESTRVRRIDASTGTIQTVAGTGTFGFSGDGGAATSAQIANPSGLAFDAAGNLYIADSNNGRVRRVDAVTGNIATVAGGGNGGDGSAATGALLSSPAGVAVDPVGNLLIAESGFGFGPSRIRRVDSITGIISTLAGSATAGFGGDGGPAAAALLNNPGSVSLDGAGNLYIADTGNYRVRFVDLASPRVTLAQTSVTVGAVSGSGTVALTIAPAGTSWAAVSSAPWLTLTTSSGSGNGSIAYSYSANPSVNPRTGAITVYGQTLNVTQSGATVTLSSSSAVIGSAAGSGTVTLSLNPAAAWTATSSAAWLTLSPLSGGAGTTLTYTYAANSANAARAGTLYIAGKAFTVLQLGASGAWTAWGSGGYGQIRTIAGNGNTSSTGDGGPATSASLVPSGVAVDGNGNLFIADSSNNRVRRVDAGSGTISTVAGNGNCCNSGGDGGPAVAASIYSPQAIALDASGNLFIADANSRIRRVDFLTGTITTVAGNGASGSGGDGGLATAANIGTVRAIVVDPAGDLYFADSFNRVRRVDASTGIVRTVTGTGGLGFGGDGGPATAALLNNPYGLALNTTGDLFIADAGNGLIRRVDAITGIITTVAGGGSGGDGSAATSAFLNSPQGVAVDGGGNLFIAEDNFGGRIRRVDAISGKIGTVAGTGNGGFAGDGGPATSALLTYPRSIALDASGNIYIADSGTYRVRFVDFSSPQVTLAPAVAAVGAAAGTGSVSLTISPAGVLWAASSTASWLTVTTPSGSGSGTIGYSFTANTGVNPRSAAITVYGQSLLVTEAGAAITLSSSSATAAAAAGSGTFNVTVTPAAAWTAASSANWLTVNPSSGSGGATVTWSATANAGNSARLGTITIGGKTFSVLQLGAAGAWTAWSSGGYGRIRTIAGNGAAGFGGDGGPGNSAYFWSPSGMAVDGNGNAFIADKSNSRIRRLDASSGVVTTIAGAGCCGFAGDGGPATAAFLDFPQGVTVDPAGNVFIADTSNNRIRRVDAMTGIITTVAGSGSTADGGDGGLATAAGVNSPAAVALDAAGDLFISESAGNRIRRVDASTGIITTIAGTGTNGFSGDAGPANAASLSAPAGLAVDAAGDVFVADTGNHRIRRIDAATGTISTVAGNGCCGFGGDGGPATAALLRSPPGVTVDAAGNLYIADTGDHRIRRVDAASGTISTVAGTGAQGYSGDGGPAIFAALNSPAGVALDGAGNLYLADTANNVIRFLDFATPQVVLGSSATTVGAAAGSGTVPLTITPASAGWSASSNASWLTTSSTGTGAGTIAYSYTANTALAARTGVITVFGQSYTVVQAGAAASISPGSAIVTAAAGSGTVNLTVTPAAPWTATSTAAWLTVSPSSGSGNATLTWNYAANAGANGRTAALTIAGKIFPVTQAGTTGTLSPWGSSGYGQIRTIAGTGSAAFSGDGGPAIQAALNLPDGIATDANGNVVFADFGNSRIRRVNSATGTITTVAGNGSTGTSGDGGPAVSAQLSPAGVSLDAGGNLYTAEPNTLRVRRVDASTGVITTVQTLAAYAIASDPAGNLFLASGNSQILRIDAVTHALTVVAGNGTSGFSGDGGPATSASLSNPPRGVALDAAGDVFIADTGNYRIRRVDAVTGTITTVAGNGLCCAVGDGIPALGAFLPAPQGVAVDGAGSVYIADTGYNRVRRVDAVTGIISTIAGTGSAGFGGDGGPATSAQLSQPEQLAFDPAGNLYVSDTGNNRVRFIDLTTPQAAFASPAVNVGVSAGSGSVGITISPAGAPWSAVSSASWLTVATASGTGSGTVGFSYSANNSVASRSAAITILGQSFLVIQAGAAVSLSPVSAAVTATAGGGSVNLTVTPAASWTAVSNANWLTVNTASGNGSGTVGYSYAANAGAASRTGAIAVAGTLFTVVQAGTSGNYTNWGTSAFGRIRTIAGTGTGGFSGDGGPGTAAQLFQPLAVTADQAGNIYIADYINYRVRRLDASTGLITTVAGTGTSGSAGDGGPATAAQISTSTSLAIDPAGNLYIAESSRIRRVDAVTQVITTVPIAATLSTQLGLFIDNAGNFYIADGRNNRILRLDQATGVLVTVAGTGVAGLTGDGGPAILAQLSDPLSVAVDSAGNIYIADTGNGVVRRVDFVTGAISTVVGSGAASQPISLALDRAGNLFIAGTFSSSVFRMDAVSGAITSVAGTGFSGYTGDGGPATAARLSQPNGIGLDGAGNLIIADTNNNRIRFVDYTTPSVPLPTITNIVNGGDFSAPPLAPGSIASIFGSLLASSTASASSVPLSTTLAGVTVAVNGVQSPIQWVSPGQINLQIPAATPTGAATVTVTSNGLVSTPFAFTVASSAPGIIANIQNQDSSLNSKAVPAAVSSTVRVNFTGAGATTPPVADGAAAPSSPVAVPAATTATVGGVAATVTSVSLYPGIVGVAQAFVTIPDGFLSGSYPLVITVNGRSSSPATVYIGGAAPSLTAVAPATAVAGGFVQITALGANFGPGTTVSWTSPTGLTANVSGLIGGGGTQITVLISASLMANTGTAQIAVTNGLGIGSNQLPFLITPFAISGITPGYQLVNGPATPVTITGSNLGTAATISFTAPGGAVTTFPASLIQSALVQATLPAIVMTSPGTAQVALANSSGALSNAVSFVITAFSVSTVNPSNTPAGSGNVQVTITGQNLTGVNTVAFSAPHGLGTVNITPDSVQAGQVTATIPAASLAGAGTASIQLLGAQGVSNPFPFYVTPFTISGVTPGSAPAGSSATLTVTGENLSTASKLYFTSPGGQSATIALSLVQAAQVAATLPAILMSTAGTAQVALADPSGALSNQLPFVITPLNTTTASLTASANPAVFGQPLTLTATVLPSQATGRVTFYDGGSILGIATVSGGQATMTTGLIPAGARNIRGRYSGDSVFAPVATGVLALTVNTVPAAGFQAPVSVSAGVNPIAIATGDFNGDGKTDVLVVNGNGGNVSVLLGNGDGTFQTAVNYATGSTPSFVAVSDFNGDGNADFVVSNQSSNTLSIFIGNGDGSFKPGVQIAAGNAPTRLIAGDFNNDGKSDLAVINQSGVGIFRGNGDGTFQTALVYSAGAAPAFLATDDFNGDGNADLAVSSQSGVYILLGNGDATFRPGATWPAGTPPYWIATGDFNRDGRIDLAVEDTGPGVSVLLGNGDGTFQPPVTYAAGGTPQSVAAADFNGDGNPDLAVANAGTNDLSVFLGNGDGTFRKQVNYSAGSGPEAVAIGDFNGDGRADLAIADLNGNNLSILLGTSSLPDLSIAKSHSGTFTQGQKGAVYTVVVSNVGGAGTTGTVSVTDTLPSGLTATNISGAGWTCTQGTLTCTRSDALSPGANYPALTVTVNIAANAAASVTNTASVSGGGETNLANDTATDPTTVQTPATLAITGPVSLPSGLVGVAYSIGATAIGGAGGYTWSATGLPPGLGINAATGVVSGAPTSNAGSPFTVVIKVTDSAAASVTSSLTLVILPAPNVTLTMSNASALSGQNVEIPIQIASVAGAVPATFQLDLIYDTTKLSFVSAREGAQSVSAGKTVTTNSPSAGDARILGSGVNQSAISNGVAAYVTFSLKPAFTSGTTSVTLSGCESSDGQGNLIAAGCGAAAVIKTPTACDINGDQQHTVSDIQLIVNEALGVSPAVHDLNHDGKVDVADVQIVINAVLGTGCSAP